jgi:hypothetical protein
VVLKSCIFDDIIFKNILLDTGYTKTLIKVNHIPAKDIEVHRRPNEILLTTNSGNFVTKYEIPLTFSLKDFSPVMKLNGWQPLMKLTANLVTT